jgi:hypothetical protein
MRLLTAMVWLAACAQPSAAKSNGNPAPQLLAGAPDGLSDVALDGDGHVWIIPERDRHLLIDGKSLPLSGVPAGLDTESIAVIGPHSALLGTESQVDGRTSDLILHIEVEGGAARVTSSETLSYMPWDLRVADNHGIEALCAAGDYVVAGIEEVLRADGARQAPLAVRRGGGPWSAWRVRLTTKTGKLSGLGCRVRAEGGLDLVGIERHFGVGRVLAFTLPASGSPVKLVPRVVVDFADTMSGDLPNFEGIAFAREPGTLLLVNDNDSGGRRGDSYLWRLTVDPARAKP